MNITASMAQRAKDHLVERILAGAWPPGTLLNRRSVADELGFSVAPVLEAMVQLENEGLLQTLPRKGTRVSVISPAQQYDLWILREALECQAARMACGKAVRKQWTALARLARTADRRALTPPEHWKNEVAFHRAIAACAGSPLLLREFERHVRLGFFFMLQQMLAPPRRRVKTQHGLLLKRLKQNDPDVAERAMREHLSPTRLKLEEIRDLSLASISPLPPTPSKW